MVAAVRDRDIVGRGDGHARAHGTDDRDSAVIDELGGRCGRHVGGDAVVVAGLRHDLAAVEAALVIDVLGREIGGIRHRRRKRIERAGEAEQDADLGVGRLCGAGEQDRGGGQAQNLVQFGHDVPLRNCPSPAPFKGIFEAGNMMWERQQGPPLTAILHKRHARVIPI